MEALETLSEIMNRVGHDRYGDEAISQLQHGLQCAKLAEEEGATPELITAALFHDIGHLVDKRFEGAAAAGIDRQHEQIGAAYLSQWFGPAVTEPVLLHVPAKRYLCAVEPEYFSTLSEASVRSLELQGRADTNFSVKHFLESSWVSDAIRLRRWDDKAKDPATETEGLEHYMAYVEVAARSRNRPELRSAVV